MNIAFDIRSALNKGTGVGTFSEHLVLAMDSLPGDHHLKLFTSSLKDRWDMDRWPKLEKSVIVDKRIPVKVLNSLWHKFSFPPVDYLVGKVDISHSPTPMIMPSNGKKIITIHDLYFLTNPEHATGEVRTDYVKRISKNVMNADGIVAVSQATANAAMELFQLDKQKIRVCSEDASQFYDQEVTEAEIEYVDELINGQYLLFVGTIEPRKNLDTLLDAFEQLNQQEPEAKLVIAGGYGWGMESFADRVEPYVKSKKLVVTGYLTQAQLRALYNRARALVMTSHCEGFGLPIVEAMACGCPSIVADNSAMPEVAGDAALLWKGDHAADLAELMWRMLADDDLRDSLAAKALKRRKLFSWEHSAEVVLDFYREVLEQ